MVKKLKFIKFLDRLSPVQVISLGFMLIIFIGSILLTLPISSTSHTMTNYEDALFTATTSVCVTGLVTLVPVLHWSAFGKLVILVLIQIGGLGFMTAISLIFSIFNRRMSIKNKLTTQNSLNETGINKLGSSVKRVVLGTFVIESVGAIFITIALLKHFSFTRAVKYGIFTSISAFCNAGIDIFSLDSMASYHSNGLLLWSIMFLIVIGGIGFPIWWESLSIIERLIIKKQRWHMVKNSISLHFKLVVYCTMVLIAVGFIGVFIFEYSNILTIGNMSIVDKINNSMFQSVTLRTAGFSTFDQASMTESTKLISMIFMFIGGSPGSTAGGIKTVTFALIIIMLGSWIRNKKQAKAHRRIVPENIVKRAFLVASLSVAILFIAILILTKTEGASITTVTYECISAIATVGLSLDFTPHLSYIGKFVIIILMFMGRIGPITLFMSMSNEKKKVEIRFPEEKVLLG